MVVNVIVVVVLGIVVELEEVELFVIELVVDMLVEVEELELVNSIELVVVD